MFLVEFGLINDEMVMREIPRPQIGTKAHKERASRWSGLEADEPRKLGRGIKARFSAVRPSSNSTHTLASAAITRLGNSSAFPRVIPSAGTTVVAPHPHAAPCNPAACLLVAPPLSSTSGSERPLKESLAAEILGGNSVICFRLLSAGITVPENQDKISYIQWLVYVDTSTYKSRVQVF
ncbi:hypothetical protein PCANC_26849 [Puccinia coronata f. sp. avenae]|uniref:Uncharacterized protein n=1 Tax=Puccinia coronata f. sp. avenae TaxID=200324 RepID=A0A2N5TQX8_9BASI|nr:hypothetical protein PCANC_26849 [Puccinia coronata f. sp. avenae]